MWCCCPYIFFFRIAMVLIFCTFFSKMRWCVVLSKVKSIFFFSRIAWGCQHSKAFFCFVRIPLCVVLSKVISVFFFSRNAWRVVLSTVTNFFVCVRICLVCCVVKSHKYFVFLSELPGVVKSQKYFFVLSEFPSVLCCQKSSAIFLPH